MLCYSADHSVLHPAWVLLCVPTRRTNKIQFLSVQSICHLGPHYNAAQARVKISNCASLCVLTQNLFFCKRHWLFCSSDHCEVFVSVFFVQLKVGSHTWTSSNIFTAVLSHTFWGLGSSSLVSCTEKFGSIHSKFHKIFWDTIVKAPNSRSFMSYILWLGHNQRLISADRDWDNATALSKK